MKSVFAILLILAVVVVFMPTAAHAATDPAGPCTSSTCSATIQRTIRTSPWGVTFISDQVNLTISSPVSNLTLGIPANVSIGLRTSAASAGGVNLQVSNLGSMTVPPGFPSSGQRYTALNVAFPRAENGSFSFNLTTVYTGLLACVLPCSPGSSNYSFQVPPFPLTDGTLKVVSAVVTLKTSDWPSPRIPPPINQTVTAGTFTTQATLPYSAFNTTTWDVTFSGTTTQNIFDVSAGRTIQILSSGGLTAIDNYNLTNLGPQISSISFTVPKGVSNIAESYVLGLQIDQPSTTPTPTANPDGTSTVTFTPSFGPLPYGQSVKVKISYTLSPGTYISAGSLGTFTLNFALFNNVQFYEPTLQTKILTPTGFRLNSLTGEVPQASNGQILLEVSTVTPISNLGFSMTYQLDPFWASLSPLGWASVAEIALAAAIVVAWKAPGAITLAGAPSLLITKFADLYDEKSSLRAESDKMEEDLARGAMNRFDYKQRRRSLDRRMNEIDRALAPVKDQLSSVLGRYQDMVKRIDRAEAELQVIRTTSSDLKSQYRTGRLSRELYDSLTSDLARRKERTEQTIDTIIINLREEVR